jgi:hypothetical protein
MRLRRLITSPTPAARPKRLHCRNDVGKRRDTIVRGRLPFDAEPPAIVRVWSSMADVPVVCSLNVVTGTTGRFGTIFLLGVLVIVIAHSTQRTIVVSLPAL